MSETLHAEVPLANDPSARTADGSLKDQTSTTQTEPLKTEPKVEPTTEPKIDPKTGKESLLSAKDDEAKGAPEKYEPFTAPEGLTLNPEVITKAEAIFKEMGLTQAQGQSLVNFYAQNAAVDAQAGVKAYEALRAEKQAEVKADPEIGSKLPQVKQTISKALDLLGDPKLAASFKEAMDTTGAGDFLPVIKAVYKWASLVTEGGHVSGKGPAATGQTAPGAKPTSLARAIYPNLPSASG